MNLEGINMKFCPNCGQSLPDDAGFCGNCGTALPEEPVRLVCGGQNG